MSAFRREEHILPFHNVKCRQLTSDGPQYLASGALLVLPHPPFTRGRRQIDRVLRESKNSHVLQHGSAISLPAALYALSNTLRLRSCGRASPLRWSLLTFQQSSPTTNNERRAIARYFYISNLVLPQHFLAKQPSQDRLCVFSRPLSCRLANSERRMSTIAEHL